MGKSRVDDLDLSFDEFAAKVNSDMVGNVVNLASRTARFAHETGLSPNYPDDGGLFAQAAAESESIAEAYEAGDFAKAMRIILCSATGRINSSNSARPGICEKIPAKVMNLRDVCTIGLNLFRQLVVYLAPVLPRLARQTGVLLNDPIASWEQSQKPLLGKAIGQFEHLMQRVDRKRVDAMVAASTEASKDAVAAQNAAVAEVMPADSDAPLQAEPLASEITFNEFAKVDLRVARVIEAEDVVGAQKLLKLTLSLGGDHRRTVFAGIKGVYKPEELLGRLVICAANLAPRKMKFGASEGMIVAAGGGETEIYLLSPDEGAKPGQRVH